MNGFEKLVEHSSRRLDQKLDKILQQKKAKALVPCPDCKDSKSYYDGADDNDEICYNCGGAGQVAPKGVEEGDEVGAHGKQATMKTKPDGYLKGQKFVG